MQSERACERPVSESDLRHIVRCGAAHTGDPRHIVEPHVQILLRITYHRRFPCRAGAGMKTHKLLFIHRKKSHGIIISEIRLICKWKLLQIRQTSDIIRSYARLIHLPAVRRRLLIDVAHRLLKLLKLDTLDLISRQGLFFRPNHVISSFIPYMLFLV